MLLNQMALRKATFYVRITGLLYLLTFPRENRLLVSCLCFAISSQK